METQKPALRFSIQPPGLFYLVACGLLNFDFERGEFQTFEAEVQKWSDDPAFIDMLFVDRKKLKDDLQKNIAEVIAKVMKQWDDENYSRMLEATWGWHIFYLSFVANSLCVTFKPSNLQIPCCIQLLRV
jgi:hypothetical protein